MKIRKRRLRRNLVYYPAAGAMALGSMFGFYSKKTAVKTKEGSASYFALDAASAASLREGLSDQFREAVRKGSHREMLEAAFQRFQLATKHLEQGKLQQAKAEADEAAGVLALLPEKLGAEQQEVRVELEKQLSELLGYMNSALVASNSIASEVGGMWTAINPFAAASPEAELVAAEPAPPLDLEMNQHIRNEIGIFQKTQRQTFVEGYRRSGAFMPFIQRALAKQGVPQELAWLPLIESGFKLRAESQAKALGLWQFMPRTGDSLGLERDRWIDSRMSPEQATEAAAAYLKYLHNRFGDWNKALAAYNWGEGNINKTIRRTGRSPERVSFWDIRGRLPNETARYVPKFQAVVHLAADPESYGFDRSEIGRQDRPTHYELVEIEKQMDMDQVAKVVGVNPSVLRDLNPELRQRVTPPQRHMLRVPVGYGQALAQQVDSIPEYRPQPQSSPAIARKAGPKKRASTPAQVAKARKAPAKKSTAQARKATAKKKATPRRAAPQKKAAPSRAATARKAGGKKAAAKPSQAKAAPRKAAAKAAPKKATRRRG
jgi:hypothetical protein